MCVRIHRIVYSTIYYQCACTLGLQRVHKLSHWRKHSWGSDHLSTTAVPGILVCPLTWKDAYSWVSSWSNTWVPCGLNLQYTCTLTAVTQCKLLYTAACFSKLPTCNCHSLLLNNWAPLNTINQLRNRLLNSFQVGQRREYIHTHLIINNTIHTADKNILPLCTAKIGSAKCTLHVIRKNSPQRSVPLQPWHGNQSNYLYCSHIYRHRATIT